MRAITNEIFFFVKKQPLQLFISFCIFILLFLIGYNHAGKGFDLTMAEGKGVGLSSMRDRVGSIGGELRVESGPGDGTRLAARCPLDKGSIP